MVEGWEGVMVGCEGIVVDGAPTLALGLVLVLALVELSSADVLVVVSYFWATETERA